MHRNSTHSNVSFGSNSGAVRQWCYPLHHLAAPLQLIKNKPIDSLILVWMQSVHEVLWADFILLKKKKKKKKKDNNNNKEEVHITCPTCKRVTKKNKVKSRTYYLWPSQNGVPPFPRRASAWRNDVASLFSLQYENNKQPYEEKRRRTCRSCYTYIYLRVKTVLRKSSLFKNYTRQTAVLTRKKYLSLCQREGS